MIIIALDFSQAKTGICVMKCNKKKPKILHTELDVTNTKIKGIERTKQTIDKVRELYKGFEMVEVERLNGINNREGTNRENKIFKELLISNYPIKEIFNNGR